MTVKSYMIYMAALREAASPWDVHVGCPRSPVCVDAAGPCLDVTEYLEHRKQHSLQIAVP